MKEKANRKQLDRFSAVAQGYSRYRPRYPERLFSDLLARVRNPGRAWDVGTGNGQVAIVLAKHFNLVFATDISAAQIHRVPGTTNVRCIVAPAENVPIPEDSIDLVTVAQAVHWFDIPAFTREVRRVGRSGAVLAVWGYGLLRCHPAVDALIDHLYEDVLGEFWDPHRAHIERAYRDIEFPFEELPSAAYTMEQIRTIDEIAGYLRTWSAVVKYRKEHNRDPVSEFAEETKALVESNREFNCITPVFLRIWRLPEKSQ